MIFGDLRYKLSLLINTTYYFINYITIEYHTRFITEVLKVTGNALNTEYYFWCRDYCFGLLIHHDSVSLHGQY